jgi:hypothetical protein
LERQIISFHDTGEDIVADYGIVFMCGEIETRAIFDSDLVAVDFQTAEDASDWLNDHLVSKDG